MVIFTPAIPITSQDNILPLPLPYQSLLFLSPLSFMFHSAKELVIFCAGRRRRGGGGGGRGESGYTPLTTSRGEFYSFTRYLFFVTNIFRNMCGQTLAIFEVQSGGLIDNRLIWRSNSATLGNMATSTKTLFFFAALLNQKLVLPLCIILSSHK